jgi:pimeloyl-ACP methyl ester carboxylesterase
LSSKNTNWRELYPFTSHWFELEADNSIESRFAGRRLHYVDHVQDEDNRNAARPMLFVHGNPTWSFYYHALIQSQSDANRCIAIDHLGCGLSDALPAAPITLAQRIAMLKSFIEQLDLKEIILCVHDWGGAIGLGTAVQMPERFAGLVIFNTAAFPPPYVPLRIRACRMPLLGRPMVQGLNLFAGPAAWMATEKGLSTQIKSGLLHPYQSWERRRAVYEFVADIPTRSSHPTWQTLEDIESRLSLISHLPSTLIWGMKDWCFRASCLERLSLHLPNAEIHQMENAGHYVVLDESEKVTQLLDRFASKV